MKANPICESGLQYEILESEEFFGDIKSGIRKISKDLDSFACVSKRSITFSGGNGRMDIPLMDLFPLPEKNNKIFNVLMERENIQKNDNYRWSYMRFCNYGMATVYFSFYHPREMRVRTFRRQFLNDLVKPAAKECLSNEDETATFPVFDFNESGNGKLRFFARDWPKVSAAIDARLEKWEYLVNNGIEHYYYYS